MKTPRYLRLRFVTLVLLTVPSILLVSGPRIALACPATGGVVYAHLCGMASDTAGRKIQLALQALGTNSGTVDARGIQQNLKIDQSLTLGSSTAPVRAVTLHLGPGIWNVCMPITVLMGSSIQGFPIGMLAVPGAAAHPQDARATMLIAGGGTCSGFPSKVVQLGDGTSGGANSAGMGAVLQDLVIDGNKVADTLNVNVAAIFVYGAWFVDLTRVTAQNSNYGILVWTSQSVDAGGGKLTKVMALFNDFSGLQITAGTGRLANDWMASESWFEWNGRYGVRLENSGAFRATNCDFGGNGSVADAGYYGAGLSTSGTSGALIITSSQFGNNYGHDMQLGGTASYSVISNNSLLGSAYRKAGYTGIQVYTAGNTIVGNSINMDGASPAPGQPPAPPLFAAVQFVGTSAPNLLMSNTFLGSPSGADVVCGSVLCIATSPEKPFPAAWAQNNLSL